MTMPNLADYGLAATKSVDQQSDFSGLHSQVQEASTKTQTCSKILNNIFEQLWGPQAEKGETEGSPNPPPMGAVPALQSALSDLNRDLYRLQTLVEKFRRL